MSLRDRLKLRLQATSPLLPSALQGHWGKVARGWRHAGYAEFPDQLLGGHAEGFGEGREGQLELGELLEAQVGGHGHGRDLDDLGRILAQDVRAQDVAVAPFHDQLAEALSVAVDHGAEQLVIADDRDRAVVAFASLGLGQSDAGVFGIGEAAGGHDLVGDLAAGAQHGVLGGQAAFVAGVGTSMLRPLMSPAAKMCGTLVCSQSLTGIRPRSAATPAAASSSPSRLAGQPTAKNTPSTTRRAGPSACRYWTSTPPSTRTSRSALAPVTTSIPRRVKAAPRAAERSWSARGTSRGAYSSTSVWQPKSARMEASWQPVSAPPMTAIRPGSAVRARRSV